MTYKPLRFVFYINKHMFLLNGRFYFLFNLKQIADSMSISDRSLQDYVHAMKHEGYLFDTGISHSDIDGNL